MSLEFRVLRGFRDSGFELWGARVRELESVPTVGPGVSTSEVRDAPHGSYQLQGSDLEAGTAAHSRHRNMSNKSTQNLPLALRLHMQVA